MTNPNPWLSIPAPLRIGISALIGLGCALLVGYYASWKYTPLVWWDVTAIVSLGSLWLSIKRFDAQETERHALQEDPGRGGADLIMLCASVASLAAVLVLIIESNSADGIQVILEVGLGVISVIISWAAVHAVYMLRYADQYFKDKKGIDFNSDEPPTYRDFAYVAFTIGMTYQVSDTSMKSGALRRIALEHALLSYVFGTAIIATTINFLAGLGK